MGLAVSYAVPLALGALVLVGHAIKQRSSGYAFGAGLLFNVSGTAAFLLAATKAGRVLNGVLWVEVAQVNMIVSAAYAAAWLAALGFAPLPVSDSPGLVVARTVAMLINEAADAVLQGVCSPAGADAAMKLGVNYPRGPFEWLADWDVAGVLGVLDALDAHYRGERYRASPWLRRRALSA